MKKVTSIYCLEKDSTPFYIGRTSNLKNRLLIHKSKYGEIDCFVLDEVVEKESYWERHYIELFKTYGFNLKNKVICSKEYNDSDIFFKDNQATELKGIRIEIQTIKFLKKQANLEGRTFSGIVNKILKDYQNANKN